MDGLDFVVHYLLISSSFCPLATASTPAFGRDDRPCFTRPSRAFYNTFHLFHATYEATFVMSEVHFSCSGIGNRDRE